MSVSDTHGSFLLGVLGVMEFGFSRTIGVVDVSDSAPGSSSMGAKRTFFVTRAVGWFTIANPRTNARRMVVVIIISWMEKQLDWAVKHI